MTLDREADQAICLIRRLVMENERLTRQVASLEQQLEASRSVGGQLDSQTAKAWVDQMAAARPYQWKYLTLGQDTWNSLKGAPDGTGLKALLLHLMAVPSDDRMGRINWDTHWRRHNPELVGKYPPRFRPNGYSPNFWLRQQGKDGLADTLDGLLKGLRPSSKAYCLTAAAFLLLDDPVAQLTLDPGAVLDQILDALREASAPVDSELWEMFSRMFQRPTQDQQQAAARQTLGIGPDADAEAIKAAHRRLVRQFHPDADTGDRDRFEAVQQAYELLTA